MNKSFKLMTAIVVFMFWISCKSGMSNPSDYIELIKNQRLSVFNPNATIGEVFNIVSKGKVLWKTGPMPQNDSEYRYRNIHITSVLVEAFWPVNFGTMSIYGNREVKLKIQFAVKKDKSEFELYRTAINGEYKNSADTKSIAQSIGVDYRNALKTIAEEKNKEEAMKWASETTSYIEAIKKKHSEIYNDTLENVYNIISSSVGNRKVEWSCQKLDSGKENIRLYLVLATCPIDEHLWNGWGATANPIVIFGHIAGDDLKKIENNKWKQGDMYAIFRKCELTNIEKIDLSKEKDIKIFKELQDYMFRTFEEKTGKGIKPSQLEIERNEMAPYIESVKKTHSNTYNDTYDNFYSFSIGSGGSKPSWSTYKIVGKNLQIDKDLLTIINAPENINNNFYLVEMRKYNRSKAICVSFFAGDNWFKATNSKIKNGDIYKVQVDGADLDLKKPEDVNRWISIFNEWLILYWMESGKSHTEYTPQAKNLEEAK